MKKCLIFVIAAALVVAFTMPASAASKVTFSGRANVAYFWDKLDATANRASNFNDTDGAFDEDGQTSAFSARFSDGPITGVAEFGMGSRITGSDISVRTRHIYGEYDFGSFKLLIGQTYEASFMPFLAGFRGGQGGYRGEATIGTRTPMIRARFNVGPGELKAAIITNKGNSTYRTTIAGAAHATYSGTPATIAAGAETDVTLPKLEVAYSAKFANFGINLCANWNTYDIVQTSTNKSWDITSYAVMGKLDASFGPLQVFGGLYTGQNLSNMGMPGSSVAAFDGVNMRVLDGESFGWSLGAKYQITPSVYFAAGYGETEITQESAVIGASEMQDDSSGYTMHFGITIAKNFDMKIGYAVRDNEDSRAAGTVVGVVPAARDQGKQKFWGTTFSMRF